MIYWHCLFTNDKISALRLVCNSWKVLFISSGLWELFIFPLSGNMSIKGFIVCFLRFVMQELLVKYESMQL